MPAWLWVAFLLSVTAMVCVDLGFFHRASKMVTVPQALAWSTAWVALALIATASVLLERFEWIVCGVLRRLPDRGIPLDRQHLRHRDAITAAR